MILISTEDLVELLILLIRAKVHIGMVLKGDPQLLRALLKREGKTLSNKNLIWTDNLQM